MWEVKRELAHDMANSFGGEVTMQLQTSGTHRPTLCQSWPDPWDLSSLPCLSELCFCHPERTEGSQKAVLGPCALVDGVDSSCHPCNQGMLPCNIVPPAISSRRL